MKKKQKKSINLINAINYIIRKKNLIMPKQSVLLAISGGQDSISLLFIFLQLKNQWNLKLGIVYCNHLWQSDSFYTILLLIKLAYLFKIPFYCTVTSKKIGTEQKARNWRYGIFQRVCLMYNYSFVFTGHTATDRVETVLFQLTRGTSTTGFFCLNWSTGFFKNNNYDSLLLQSFTLQKQKQNRNKKLFKKRDLLFNLKNQKFYEFKYPKKINRLQKNLPNWSYFYSSKKKSLWKQKAPIGLNNLSINELTNQSVTSHFLFPSLLWIINKCFFYLFLSVESVDCFLIENLRIKQYSYKKKIFFYIILLKDFNKIFAKKTEKKLKIRKKSIIFSPKLELIKYKKSSNFPHNKKSFTKHIFYIKEKPFNVIFQLGSFNKFKTWFYFFYERKKINRNFTNCNKISLNSSKTNCLKNYIKISRIFVFPLSNKNYNQFNFIYYSFFTDWLLWLNFFFQNKYLKSKKKNLFVSFSRTNYRWKTHINILILTNFNSKKIIPIQLKKNYYIFLQSYKILRFSVTSLISLKSKNEFLMNESSFLYKEGNSVRKFFIKNFDSSSILKSEYVKTHTIYKKLVFSDSIFLKKKEQKHSQCKEFFYFFKLKHNSFLSLSQKKLIKKKYEQKLKCYLSFNSLSSKLNKTNKEIAIFLKKKKNYKNYLCFFCLNEKIFSIDLKINVKKSISKFPAKKNFFQKSTCSLFLSLFLKKKEKKEQKPNTQFIYRKIGKKFFTFLYWKKFKKKFFIITFVSNKCLINKKKSLIPFSFYFFEFLKLIFQKVSNQNFIAFKFPLCLDINLYFIFYRININRFLTSPCLVKNLKDTSLTLFVFSNKNLITFDLKNGRFFKSNDSKNGRFFKSSDSFVNSLNYFYFSKPCFFIKIKNKTQKKLFFDYKMLSFLQPKLIYQKKLMQYSKKFNFLVYRELLFFVLEKKNESAQNQEFFIFKKIEFDFYQIKGSWEFFLKKKQNLKSFFSFQANVKFSFITKFPKKISLIRPILLLNRFDIKKLCNFWNLPLYPDKSNQKIRYYRNRIRKQLLPVLRFFFNPQIDIILFQFIEIANTEQIYLNFVTTRIIQQLKSLILEKPYFNVKFQINKHLYFNCSFFNLLPLSIQRRVLKNSLEKINMKKINFFHIEKIVEFIHQKRKLNKFFLKFNDVTVNKISKFFPFPDKETNLNEKKIVQIMKNQKAFFKQNEKINNISINQNLSNSSKIISSSTSFNLSCPLFYKKISLNNEKSFSLKETSDCISHFCLKQKFVFSSFQQNKNFLYFALSKKSFSLNLQILFSFSVSKKLCYNKKIKNFQIEQINLLRKLKIIINQNEKFNSKLHFFVSPKNHQNKGFIHQKNFLESHYDLKEIFGFLVNPKDSKNVRFKKNLAIYPKSREFFKSNDSKEIYGFHFFFFEKKLNSLDSKNGRFFKSPESSFNNPKKFHFFRSFFIKKRNLRNQVTKPKIIFFFTKKDYVDSKNPLGLEQEKKIYGVNIFNYKNFYKQPRCLFFPKEGVFFIQSVN